MSEYVKECNKCKSKGWFKLRIGYLFLGGFEALPTYRKCNYCGGYGYVPMTLDEIEFEKECIRIDNNLSKYI